MRKRKFARFEREKGTLDSDGLWYQEHDALEDNDSSDSEDEDEKEDLGLEAGEDEEDEEEIVDDETEETEVIRKVNSLKPSSLTDEK